MTTLVLDHALSYQQRIDALRASKLAQTREKREVIGSMNFDDWAVVLPPKERRRIIEATSASGVVTRDALLADVQIKSNHPSGGFFGARLVGENFREILTKHPVYIDPMSSLAGAYMVNFSSYINPRWNPDFDYSHLCAEQEKYSLMPGIGGMQHFAQDLKIGLGLGWGGLLAKIQHYREVNAPNGADFYYGLEQIILGVQDWIGRHAEAAYERAAVETNPELRHNFEEMVAINQYLIDDPPRTFREACQWILWYQIVARMFNGSGSLGRLDAVLALLSAGYGARHSGR
ncbi:MAG: pyruvate formate lyase family protein [Chloroflexota bacterium]